jgi:DNA mismatch endonuclease, patch repair protein
MTKPRTTPTVKSPSFNGFQTSSASATKTMQANRARGTSPERLLQQALRQLGVRYTTHVKSLLGCPDFVFRAKRTLVFCDGDFWHGRSWPKLRSSLKRRANPEYWTAKIAANRERDRRQTRALEKDGWIVIRIWEGDIRRDPKAVALQIVSVIDRRDNTSRRKTRPNGVERQSLP